MMVKFTSHQTAHMLLELGFLAMHITYYYNHSCLCFFSWEETYKKELENFHEDKDIGEIW